MHSLLPLTVVLWWVVAGMHVMRPDPLTEWLIPLFLSIPFVSYCLFASTSADLR